MDFFEENDENDALIEDDNEQMPHSRAATRRKNDWKYANRRKNILNHKLVKPLHYYSKNMPASYSIDKRPIRREKRQNDDFKNQVNELFDFD